MNLETGIVGGVCMAHAPQFFTLPPTEDKDTVERVNSLAIENGRQLEALNPDFAIVIANDHANQFLLHCVPSFALHRGARATGHFAGTDFSFDVDSETSTYLLRYLQEEKFDPAFSSTAKLDYAFGIPLTFLGIDLPVIPLYVNAYVPPQPRIERCYHLGQHWPGPASPGQACRRGGQRRAVPFSGNRPLCQPSDEIRPQTNARTRHRNLRWLLSLDDRMLDKTGNIELRCWAVAAGMLGERVPDMVSFDPSWHHNYATFAWWSAQNGDTNPLHYPAIAPERVTLTDALHRIANDDAERARFSANRVSFAAGLNLSPEEKAALIAMDENAFTRLGVHPFVPFMARLQLEREG